ncbi:NUDIX domain-containing protein [Actinospica robiniae]|uniref:NUDIX domain-containing protein n=1 Tax=Actinospica robiniae TaxID=304901 RepID=UPI000551EB0F|nr:NUDIX domain-containing protein [Actinospica robiniae]
MSRLLGEIHHAEGLDLAAGVVERTAVRAIVLRGRELLLLHSPHNADYKFPGGGVETGESDDDALRREMLEECGANVTAILEPFGEIVEYSATVEAQAAVFRMVSRYVRCEVDDRFGQQNLEQYERDLELAPVWVDVADAIRLNEAIQRERGAHAARWNRRETLALRSIERELL